ncbi:MAG TPA: AmmeMemoRadiSam system protein B [Burkholderiaceae bacterium]|nr:AmmeMemoRadiSam system protein B [Burkholderiaceae bacterium]HQR75925.1 AmmeMemoRadiSam system protein B [Burkholderiaceae bacterium]
MIHLTTAAVRPAAVAGMFYPADAQTLRAEVDRLLGAAPRRLALAPKALIVPHAGYPYSGPIAAAAYACLASHAEQISRVVLIGPAHRVAVRGIATPGADRFATPLGEVPLETAALAALETLPHVSRSARAHAEEHALEVQLPFLQRVLHKFSLVPLLVGDTTVAEVAQALDRVWGDEETLIVVSSDLSHYLPYAEARRTDAATLDAILRRAPGLHGTQACGATPINGLLQVALQRGLAPELLDARNSGDTAGDRARVVGYAAVAFRELDRGQPLLQVARDAIEGELQPDGSRPPHTAACLSSRIASFVTLRRHGELRGCVGGLEPDAVLRLDLPRHARAAAFEDPRFPPLRREELDGLRIEVSLLTPSESINAESEADVLAALRPGVDGVILTAGNRRATFLPQVWHEIASATEFLRHLKLKAGLHPDAWSAHFRVARYTAEKWVEA